MYKRGTSDLRTRSTQSASPGATTEKEPQLSLSPSTVQPSPRVDGSYQLRHNYNHANGKNDDVLPQKNFDETYGFRRINTSLFNRVKFHYKQTEKWKSREWLLFVSSRIPITHWLYFYHWKTDFIVDLLGGFMISIMSVPQSLAYGMLVGVPASYGLITGVIGPLIYAMFGTSKHASPGAFAIVALMVGAAVEKYGGISNASNIIIPTNNPNVICCKVAKEPVSEENAIEIATFVTLLIGLFQILFGLMNAGLLSVWLSDQLVQGLTSGAAVHVLTSQLKSMTGLLYLPPTSEPFGLIKFYICFFNQITNCHLPSVIFSSICVVCLLFSAYVIDPKLCKKVPVKFPMELILVVLSTLVIQFTNIRDFMEPRHLVGNVDSGFVMPRIPRTSNWDDLIGPAISISIISFVIHIALCKLVSKRLNYVIDSNQEWMALGIMHTVSSFFGCFAGGSSLGRTMMQVKCGTKSQLSTIVCSLILVIFVYGAVGLIENLPKAVLASIVVVALKDLFIQIYDSFFILKESYFDFLIFAVTFLSVVILNVNFGLLIGVAFALLTVVFRTQWADSTLLGRIMGTNHFRGLSHYAEAKEVPGIKIFRFDSQLYFANSELFLNRIFNTCGLNPVVIQGKLADQKKREKTKTEDMESLIPKDAETQLEVKGQQIKAIGEKPSETSMHHKDDIDIVQMTHIIVDCSSMPYIDLMGKDALIQTYVNFKLLDIEVLFANTKEIVRQMFDATNFYKTVPENRVFISVSDAVSWAMKERNRFNDTSSKGVAVPKPKIKQAAAKSVVQKTAPLGGDATLPTTQASTTLLTQVDNSETKEKRRSKWRDTQRDTMKEDKTQRLET